MQASYHSETLRFFQAVDTPVHIFFMRHGQSIANQGNIFQGRANSDLSAEGRRQAALSSAYFTQHALDCICSSSLTRANETARIVAEKLGKNPENVQVFDELLELDTGVFSEKSFDDIKTKEPELWKAYQKQSWDAVPEAEGRESLQKRAFLIWELIAKMVSEGKRAILCVSHGGIMQWIIKMSFTSSGVWMPLIEVSNCGIFHLYLRPSDAATAVIATWKRLNHTVYQRDS